MFWSLKIVLSEMMGSISSRLNNLMLLVEFRDHFPAMHMKLVRGRNGTEYLDYISMIWVVKPHQIDLWRTLSMVRLSFSVCFGSFWSTVFRGWTNVSIFSDTTTANPTFSSWSTPPPRSLMTPSSKSFFQVYSQFWFFLYKCLKKNW